MKMFSILAVSFLVVAASSPTVAPNRTPDEARTFPVQLLPGYRVKAGASIDSWGAKIWKDSGLTIEFSQGLHEEVEADSVDSKDVVWRDEQLVNSQRVICVTRNRTI
jgi:hypothetical protein